MNDRFELFEGTMEHLVSDDMCEWLVSEGFFAAPASTRFHGNHEGGLFDHSFAVAHTLEYMTASMNLVWQHPRSPRIIGMFHDLCKIDSYNLLEDGTYEHSKDLILKGHAEKSLILLSRFMTLTEEEILCIRFHMGAYEKDDWDGYDKAIKKYPNVLWTHHADMYVSKVKGL